MHNIWLKEILAEDNLQNAYTHVIKQRLHYPPSSDVWIVMERWADYKLMMIKSVMTDKYRISPMIKFKMPNIAGVTAIWSTIDAILIKSIATYLSDKLTNNISDKCTHLKTHGGLQMATKLTATYVAIKENCFYFRGDVANFYHDIDHDILIGKIKSIVPATEEILLKILCQVIRRTEVYKGEYYEVTKGIALGSAISPLFAAIVLKELDEKISALTKYYVRFMDDWIILAKSKEYLHKILSVMNNVLRELKLDLASSKSYKGQVIHGFNFLGFYFCSNFYNTPSINGTLAFLAKLFQKNVRYDALNYFVAWRAWVKGCLLYKPKIYYKQILIWLSLLKIGVLEISLIFCAYMIDLSMKVFI